MDEEATMSDGTESTTSQQAAVSPDGQPSKEPQDRKEAKKAPKERLDAIVLKLLAIINPGLNGATMIHLMVDEIQAILEDEHFVPHTSAEIQEAFTGQGLDLDGAMKNQADADRADMQLSLLSNKQRKEKRFAPHAPTSGLLSPVMSFAEFGGDVQILREVARLLEEKGQDKVDIMSDDAKNFRPTPDNCQIPTAVITVADIRAERAKTADRVFRLPRRLDDHGMAELEKRRQERGLAPASEAVAPPSSGDERTTRSSRAGTNSRGQSVSTETPITAKNPKAKATASKRAQRDTSQTSTAGAKKTK